MASLNKKDPYFMNIGLHKRRFGDNGFGFVSNGENGVDKNGVSANEEETFEMVHINDFTSEELKAETNKLEETKELGSMPVCAAYHGGSLDYPKVKWIKIVQIFHNFNIFFFEGFIRGFSQGRLQMGFVF